MKSIKYVLMAAASMLLFACNKQEADTTTQEEAVISHPISISAVLDENTKAEVSSSGTFSWTESTDKVAYHTADGYLVSEGADASAATANFTIDGGKFRNFFAIFPYTLVYNVAESEVYENSKNAYGDGGSLVVNLPDTYTLAQVTDNVSPCPMIATSADESWNFKQLCGMLRLTVNSIPKSANKITVDFNGKKVTGAFSIASPAVDGSAVIKTNEGTGSAEDIITITFSTNASWRDGVVINLPLPVSPDGESGKYGNITVKAFADSKELLSLTRGVKLNTTYDMDRAIAKKTTVSFPVFSVAENTRVAMAATNLRYTRDAEYRGYAWINYKGEGWTSAQGEWSFMDNPWDKDDTDAYGGGSSAVRDYLNHITIGRFSWGTSGKTDWATGTYGALTQPWNTGYDTGKNPYSANNRGYGPYSGETQIIGSLTGDTYKYGDWGVYNNAVLGNPNPTWRTMTLGEWRYILGLNAGQNIENDANTKRNQMWGHATVNGQMGIIIVPDCFVDPMKNAGSGAFVGGIASTCSGANSNVYTEEQWTYMAAMGACFLPAHGVRRLNGTDYFGDYGDGEEGHYHTVAGVTDGYIFEILFTSSTINTQKGIGKADGLCVRLVRNIN